MRSSGRYSQDGQKDSPQIMALAALSRHWPREIPLLPHWLAWVRCRPRVNNDPGAACRQALLADERAAVDALLRQLDFRSGELAAVSKELAAEALGDPVVARLMTIPGVDALTAISIIAAVGDFHRFDSPGKLVSYLGPNPKVRQSGNSGAVHGRIGKAGRSQVRGILVEAAWSPARAASSSSPPERHPGAAPAACPPLPTAASRSATRNGRQPSRSNAPARSSSPTGSTKSRPPSAGSLEDFIVRS
jgi:Transposase IS116/IS110/IS902 family